MRLTLLHLVVLIAMGAGCIGCNKTKNWKTEVIGFEDVSHYTATVIASYAMPKNNQDMTIGLCWSELPKPTFYDNALDLKKSTTTYREEFQLTGLNAETIYYVRSYIVLKNKEIIYSPEVSFTTEEIPLPPCETESGIISFSGIGAAMGSLHEWMVEEDHYQLQTTSFPYVQLDFIFKQKPTRTDVYKTTFLTSDLEDVEIEVNGVFGSGGITCAYTASKDQNIYVTVAENGAITITFCDLKMSTNQSCETYQYLNGEVHEP